MTTTFHDPGGLGFRIETMWAFLSTNGPEDDDEGVIAFEVGGAMMPMVAADERRLTQLRPLAERAARISGRPVKLCRFDRRTDLETIEP